ncbi:hypothetical protein VP01_11674g1, partial [Puccinia sorghi]
FDLATRSRKPTDIASVLNKEGQLNLEEQSRREREGFCLYFGGKLELDSCVKRISRESAKLAKKKEGSSLETCKETLPIIPFSASHALSLFPVYLVNSSKEPSFWVLKKT